MKNALPKFFLLVACLLGLSFASFGLVSGQTGAAAEVGIFDDFEVRPGSRFEVPISIRNVDELYAVDIRLTFDSEILQIEDANLAQEGVQLGLGSFLDAGLVLFNTADNESGTIRFAMTQVNPSEAKSGEGVLLVLYVQALTEGESQIAVEMVDLSSRAGEAIPGAGVASTVVVGDDAEEKESTPIPVQDPTTIIQVPSLQPTATPTQLPDPTQTPVVEDAESSTTTDAERQNEESLSEIEGNALSEDTENEQNGNFEVGQEPSDGQQTDGFSLLRYWWAVAILAAAVIGLAIYLVLTRR
jgi:hypothetical protein